MESFLSEGRKASFATMLVKGMSRSIAFYDIPIVLSVNEETETIGVVSSRWIVSFGYLPGELSSFVEPGPLIVQYSHLSLFDQ